MGILWDEIRLGSFFFFCQSASNVTKLYIGGWCLILVPTSGTVYLLHGPKLLLDDQVASMVPGT